VIAAARLQEWLDSWCASARRPTEVATAAIRLDGRLLWTGVARADRPVKAPAAQRFPIYSITKTLTAICVLSLDATGIVNVNRPVVDWVPEPRLPRSMTVAHLLRHTSGIPDYGSLRQYHDAVRSNPSAPWTDEQFIDIALRPGLLFAPGTGWSYSNVGFLLLRRLIERFCGASFRHCVNQLIVEPLRLADTFVADSIADWDSCVPGYGDEVRSDGAIVDVRPTYHPRWCGPGVAVSTVEDVTRVFDALFAGDLIDQKQLREMLRLTPVPGSHPPAVTPSSGMGILADPGSPFGSSFGHTGAGPGYDVMTSILPDFPAGRLSVALFRNCSVGQDARRSEHELLRTLLADQRDGAPNP
jgi:D-alanyl-D-alanine carboxypeptidase